MFGACHGSMRRRCLLTAQDITKTAVSRAAKTNASTPQTVLPWWLNSNLATTCAPICSASNGSHNWSHTTFPRNSGNSRNILRIVGDVRIKDRCIEQSMHGKPYVTAKSKKDLEKKESCHEPLLAAWLHPLYKQRRIHTTLSCNTGSGAPSIDFLLQPKAAPLLLRNIHLSKISLSHHNLGLRSYSTSLASAPLTSHRNMQHMRSQKAMYHSSRGPQPPPSPGPFFTLLAGIGGIVVLSSVLSIGGFLLTLLLALGGIGYVAYLVSRYTHRGLGGPLASSKAQENLLNNLGLKGVQGGGFVGQALKVFSMMAAKSLGRLEKQVSTVQDEVAYRITSSPSVTFALGADVQVYAPFHAVVENSNIFLKCPVKGSRGSGVVEVRAIDHGASPNADGGSESVDLQYKSIVVELSTGSRGRFDLTGDIPKAKNGKHHQKDHVIEAEFREKR